ncbi:MAG: hypothetical protein CV045_02820 [Cyanobacteria bacterium M5B4]|nr:MAG: hypothetical protein CV045_02820 [Cyanobacteria bacterium M5B4]
MLFIYFAKKKSMSCNRPRRIKKGEPGYGKKKFVVKACQNGEEKIIRYGDANMKIKNDIPKRKKSYCSRSSGIGGLKNKLKANYWSRKQWKC